MTARSGRSWCWVVLGVAGLLLIAMGVVADSAGLMETRGSWWRLGFTLPGHVVLLYSWWRLGPSPARPMRIIGIWAASVALVVPLHSRDAYSYAAQGWLMARGLDPYVVASGEAGAPGLLVGMHWSQTTSVYPPGSLAIFAAVSRLTGGDLLWTPIAMRLPNLVALAVVAWCLVWLSRRFGLAPGPVLWWGLANPVVIVQWVGGIHNDAVMVAVVALAFVAAVRWPGWAGFLVSGALIGLAVSIKQSAAVAGVGAVALAWAATAASAGGGSWRSLGCRAAAAGAAAVGVFTAITVGSGLGLGWRNPTAGSPLGASSNAPISWVGSLLRGFGIGSGAMLTDVLTIISGVLVVVAVAWVVWRWGPRPPERLGRPWPVAVFSLAAFALLGPGLQPWYITWALPFVALARPSGGWARAWLLAVGAASLLAPLQDVVAPYIAMALLAVPAVVWWRRESCLGAASATSRMWA
ncbi:MAG: polyprenol phosphomannose-dependent alpha 1,6 mannosyltransferase MptB [Arachnia sp.]